jgi:hypothetical protein
MVALTIAPPQTPTNKKEGAKQLTLHPCDLDLTEKSLFTTSDLEKYLCRE